MPANHTATIKSDKRRRSAPYQARSTKRKTRRTRADVDAIKAAMLEVFAVEKPMTCRQMFYQLVSRGVITKLETEYKGTVIRLLVDMRVNRTIPFDWIADNTRWVRKRNSYSGIGELLDDMQSMYRRDLWRNQPTYVEIWLEKDALAGVLVDVTYEWDVPLMVSRGYPSVTYLQSAAIALAAQGKPCHLYHFGDHDPSGVDITANIERRLRQFAPDADIHFERIAVTPKQIKKWKLPTRPTKTTDTRSGSFEGDSVDVDAIAPSKLRELCESCITRHVDPERLERTRNVERQERRTLADYVAELEESGDLDNEDDDDGEGAA